MKEILNYIKVNENIATSGQLTKKQFKQIAKEGYDVVINLAMHNRGALPQEDKIVSKNGMLYIHIPVTWEKPELERLTLFLKLLESLQKENKRVFIHCIKNYRASVFIFKYKQCILKEKDAKLIAPKEYKPSKVWQEIIDADILPSTDGKL
ncbi:protein tyrosine phosphatase family protein [bacterium]|nr:protein tyrosine phosphatase family protein [bacterium]MBU1883250.1 protein tyrosine phosphatase family protein [bacterium]